MAGRAAGARGICCWEVSGQRAAAQPTERRQPAGSLHLQRALSRAGKGGAEIEELKVSEPTKAEGQRGRADGLGRAGSGAVQGCRVENAEHAPAGPALARMLPVPSAAILLTCRCPRPSRRGAAAARGGSQAAACYVKARTGLCHMVSTEACRALDPPCRPGTKVSILTAAAWQLAKHPPASLPATHLGFEARQLRFNRLQPAGDQGVQLQVLRDAAPLLGRLQAGSRAPG